MTNTPFLKLVAQHILQTNSSGLDKICLIFPSRRAITYFYKYLSECISDPVWAPACYTIADFYQKFSSLHVAHSLLLNAHLFRVYQQIHPNTEDFEHFYAWGNVLLSDFDDIDKYRIDAKLLFSNLARVKQIDQLFPHLTPEQQELIERFWHHYTISRESKEKEQFSQLWEHLYGIYEKFKNTLRQLGIAYEGMLFREVADAFDSNSVQIPYERVGFVGLHALTECDRVVLNYFKATGKALFYWDFDPYFIDNEKHEAGFFIQQNLKQFPNSLPKEKYENKTPECIQIITVPYQVGQAKWVENILNDFIHDNNLSEPENTAIVLSNESLLHPLLRAIPPHIGYVNVTMGYPIRLTNIYTLFQQISELHLQGKQKYGFYFKQVETLLYHPYFLKIIPEWVRAFVAKMHAANQVHISASAFTEAPVPIIADIFKDFESTDMLIDTLLKICNNLYSLLFGTDEVDDADKGKELIIEKESLQMVRTYLTQLQTVVDSVGFSVSPVLGMRILMKGLRELKITFEGEPLRGIQIMGFLETRSLDFEKIIILSANEGYLPQNNVPLSFIPYSLRAANGLPTIKHRDAIYAYYFYRLLARSSHVWIMYSTSGENITEKSRYIRQIEKDPDSKYKVQQKNMAFSLETIGIAPITITKNADILHRIISFLTTAQSYLSPSAVASYLNCPLQFYFRYIIELKPELKIQEKVDNATLGTVLHSVMYRLYADYCNKNIGEVNFDNKVIKQLIDDSIRNYYKLDTVADLPATAKIMQPVVEKFCELIVNYDRQYCSDYRLLAVEKSFVTTLKISSDYTIRLGGRVDRIDCSPWNQIRIVDYKTGTLGSPKYRDVTDLFTRENWKKREFLQALIYAWLYYQNTQKLVKPVLYNVQRIVEKNMPVEVPVPNTIDTDKIDSFFMQFKNSIVSLLEEILNPEMPFVQTSEKEICKYCAYNQICRR